MEIKICGKVQVPHEPVSGSWGEAAYTRCTKPGIEWIGEFAFFVYPEGAMTYVKPDASPRGEEKWTEPKGMAVLGSTSLLMAALQSLCTAVLTISGIRVAIGLTALAAASGVYAPAQGFHQDAIRIPMLILAAAGAIINLAVLAWIRHLRSRPSAQWRRRELSPRQKRSERLQIVLALVTLILVGLETWTHPMVHRTGPPPAGVHAQNPSSGTE